MQRTPGGASEIDGVQPCWSDEPPLPENFGCCIQCTFIVQQRPLPSGLLVDDDVNKSQMQLLICFGAVALDLWMSNGISPRVSECKLLAKSKVAKAIRMPKPNFLNRIIEWGSTDEAFQGISMFFDSVFKSS